MYLWHTNIQTTVLWIRYNYKWWSGNTEPHGKPLEYWKKNAEEDYIKVPISVLKYITILEEIISENKLK